MTDMFAILGSLFLVFLDAAVKLSSPCKVSSDIFGFLGDGEEERERETLSAKSSSSFG
jgi:hypothetical protein